MKLTTKGTKKESRWANKIS